MDKETAKRLLELAGPHPSDDQVEATVHLHEYLAEQLAQAPAGSLENVEPHYIQPTRVDRRRRQRTIAL